MAKHTNPNEPYYARHKVTELTCPHCTGMLVFLINERHHSVHACRCGRWLRAIDWAAPAGTPAKWTYEAKQEGGTYEHKRNTP